MTDLLFVRPGDDSAAIQVGAWGQAVRQKITGLTFSELAGGPATRAAVDQELAAGHRHLFWFGHGRDDALIVSGAAVVDDGNVGSLIGGVIVAIACYAAVGLAGQAVHAGVSAFLGFDDEFGFPANAPIPMGRAVVQGLDCLFTQRHDIGCAVDQLREHLDQARLEYKANGAAWGLAPSEARLAWLFAKSNRSSLQLHGDPSTTL